MNVKKITLQNWQYEEKLTIATGSKENGNKYKKLFQKSGNIVTAFLYLEKVYIKY
jgi:hypothetical protein